MDNIATHLAELRDLSREDPRRFTKIIIGKKQKSELWGEALFPFNSVILASMKVNGTSSEQRFYGFCRTKLRSLNTYRAWRIVKGRMVFDNKEIVRYLEENRKKADDFFLGRLGRSYKSRIVKYKGRKPFLELEYLEEKFV